VVTADRFGYVGKDGADRRTAVLTGGLRVCEGTGAEQGHAAGRRRMARMSKRESTTSSALTIENMHAF
jgi:hypothetical protein